jgi:hypothetical protein
VRRTRAIAACLLAGAAAAASVQAAVFLESTDGRVTHAGAYDGSPGVHVINVCQDSTAQPIVGDPAQATRNVVAELNRFRGQLGNVVGAAAVGVGSGKVDYESMLMHEMGHCLGLDHNVLGPSEVGCTIDGSCVGHPTLFFVNAFRGPNSGFDGQAGLDGERGTGDDLRLDDVNRHWYRVGNNDPFEEAAIADRTTHARSGLLPPGDLFAEAVANFSPCTQGAAASRTWQANGRPPTQDVLFPVLCIANAVRSLSPNDRTAFRIARAGLDGIAATADDYSIRLNYVEFDASDCDVLIRFPDGGGFHCAADVRTLANGDTTIADGADPDRFAAIISLQRSTNWFFNQVDTTVDPPADYVFCSGFEDASAACE